MFSEEARIQHIRYHPLVHTCSKTSKSIYLFIVVGQYLFIESSLPRRPGDKARIQSEQFTATPSNGRCMKFWYHMFGPDIGNLTVYINVTGAAKLAPLWRLSGKQGNKWLQGKLPINSAQTYMVRADTCLFLRLVSEFRTMH
jgi:hypothetical protein